MRTSELTEQMLERYGECVKRAEACRILGCGVRKLATLLEIGKVKTACEGTRVSVRSLAEYIETPEETAKTQVNLALFKRRTGARWAV